ncbi:MAG: sulfatase-like hydrolase/transferase [Bryobacterales bacterium]|nr:sulfatase-like hydrolase/transferase [Bryobacterales bacterium]
MTRRELLGAAAGAATGPFLRTAKAQRGRGARRTNVVMFMTDDHGAWATSVYGCGQMKTPNMQKLADGGARFDRAFACTPVCSPSRATYITGVIPSVHGVQDWLRPEDSFGLKTRRWLNGHVTYSEVLANAGYTLGLSGKWHMGDDERAQQGFTYWATIPGGGGPYRNVEFIRNGSQTATQPFKTDAVGDFAMEFLDQQKDRENPFYLLMPFYAPHTPFDYQPQAYRAPYENSSFECFPRGPMHPWQNRNLRPHHNNTESMRSYSSLITAADANVGRVLAKLEELGKRDDTLVVFTADQGYNAGQHGVWGKGNGTWPFNMYEQSIRVPMIWNHPGRIRAGQVVNEMVSSYDYFPTILDYLGVKPPGGASHRMGRSYAGLLRGRRPRAWENRLLFEYSYVRAIRTETLKFVERTKEWPSELFDLEADPGETKNRIDDPAYAGRLATLRKEMAAWFDKAGAPPLEQWRGTTKQELTDYTR